MPIQHIVWYILYVFTMMIPSPILFSGCLYSAGAVLVEFILKEYRPSRILQKLVSFLRHSVFTTVRALLFN
nr:MAG TPA: hypothetical protein [Caudoviricetes sp.]